MTPRIPEPLKAEHDELHEALVLATRAGGRTGEAARAEGHPEHVHFAEKLVLHAKTEEEVLYPATILLGEYLKAGGRPHGRA